MAREIKAKNRRRTKPIPRTARSVALYRLGRIEEEGAYINLSRHRTSETPLDARDERLANEYVAGITRWKRWLDFQISTFYRGPFEKIEIRLLQILRIGLYDLLFLDTPPHAALYESVSLTKLAVGKGAGSIANGMLRNVLRNIDDLPQPETGNVARDLAIRYSHPSWMVRRWLKRFGYDESLLLLKKNNERPEYGLSINIFKTSIEDFQSRLSATGLEWSPSPYMDEFVRLKSLQPVIRAGLLSKGLCVIQDEGAGLIVQLLDPQPDESVTDTCAAPGGKALLAARKMQNRGVITALDVHKKRLMMVDKTAKKLGIKIIRSIANDLRAFVADSEITQVDRVLVDAPCSGLGVLAKRADLRWNRKPEDLQELVQLQRDLLYAASKLVRPGGLLVYGTCTIEPEENEEQVAAFLAKHSDFRLESAEGFVPSTMVTPEGYYAALPHRHGLDGAFGARLRRSG